MKTKILAILMVAVISVSLFIFPASAAEVETASEHTHIEVFFEDDTISEELKAKATAFYLNGGEEEESSAWGLTCTILGHKYEDASTTVITHKARATAPRCLKNIYLYQTCTRCGHEKSTLMESFYIYCCA